MSESMVFNYEGDGDMFLAFLFFGIFLVVLSGLEKIIIYLHFANSVGSIEALKAVVPDYIWLITNLTFIGGCGLIIIGVIPYVPKLINK